MATNTLAVKIDKSLKMGRSVPVAVSAAWRIKLSNAKNITTIVAISKQRAIDVFSVSSPSVITAGPNTGRVEFRSITRIPKSCLAKYQAMGPFNFNSALKYI